MYTFFQTFNKIEGTISTRLFQMQSSRNRHQIFQLFKMDFFYLRNEFLKGRGDKNFLTLEIFSEMSKKINRFLVDLSLVALAQDSPFLCIFLKVITSNQ